MTGLVWDVDKLRIATEAAGIALWSWNVDTDQLELDERGYALWGIPNTGTVTFEALSACIHPEDLDRVRAAFAATRDMLGSYEPIFVSSAMARSVGYQLEAGVTIRASSEGSCMACSST
jgi:hypothetical protein